MAAQQDGRRSLDPAAALRGLQWRAIGLVNFAGRTGDVIRIPGDRSTF